MKKNAFLNYFIAFVWLANGLLCKLLHLVPRHQQIVASILGNEHAGLLTKLIGTAEILMGLWVLSGLAVRLNVLAQVVIIATMNVLEFLLVPDLLLWGRWNAFFALILIITILYNEFYIRIKPTQTY
jgi:hypothetical protein